MRLFCHHWTRSRSGRRPAGPKSRYTCRVFSNSQSLTASRYRCRRVGTGISSAGAWSPAGRRRRPPHRPDIRRCSDAAAAAASVIFEFRSISPSHIVIFRPDPFRKLSTLVNMHCSVGWTSSRLPALPCCTRDRSKSSPCRARFPTSQVARRTGVTARPGLQTSLDEARCSLLIWSPGPPLAHFGKKPYIPFPFSAMRDFILASIHVSDDLATKSVLPRWQVLSRASSSGGRDAETVPG